MNKLTISIVILTVVFIGAIGVYFIFQKPSLNTTSPVNVSTNVKPLFGTMIAYNLNDAAMDTPGILDTIQQKGWTEFKKDDSSYKLRVNNEKLVDSTSSSS